MKRILTLLLSFGITYGAAVIGSAVTFGSVDTWYAALAKPALNPPSWVFAPVWTMLYAFMAFAAWRVYEKPAAHEHSRSTLVIYGIQLVLNASWSVAFFGFHAPLVALGILIALLLSILVLTIFFWRIDRVAGILFIPYLVWVSFATYLNVMIVLLN